MFVCLTRRAGIIYQSRYERSLRKHFFSKRTIPSSFQLYPLQKGKIERKIEIFYQNILFLRLT